MCNRRPKDTQYQTGTESTQETKSKNNPTLRTQSVMKPECV